MADDTGAAQSGISDVFGAMLQLQADATRSLLGQFSQSPVETAAQVASPDDIGHWADVAQRMQTLWLDFQSTALNESAARALPDTSAWFGLVESWYKAMPLADAATQAKMFDDGMKLWQGLLGQFGGDAGAADLPRKDKRFADPRWREQPVFALIHQSYLLFAEQLAALAERAEGLDDDKREQLRFTVRTLTEALSPANFPMTNPVVLQKTLESKGENLVKGMEHLLADLKRGQLTHTDSTAFELGRNIAVTPGKVVHESPLFQLIQYSPTTENVLEVPLVVFPPWINRFYILDLNPQKSFVRWAVEQGITVFMVSWKSADESMADVVWDDYIRAEIEAIDTIRERLGVPSVHAIGYCVAGTTLAAALAVLARRDQADKVKSATFFTAQVDFEAAGELKNFIDDHQMATMAGLAKDGYLDGRYMAATFNLLRGSDLIWSYVINNYLLGEDYPAFDLLAWNGDVTNLPLKWHQAYLKDLYRDNRLVVPDSMAADGTPIDLTRITTPCYIQAGREDHIAPPDSVWKLTRHLRGDWIFVLAGSGHIAGVVNPPAAGKYQYWTNPGSSDSLEQFVAGASETKGSWWPHWREWLGRQDGAEVPAKGKRAPGGKGDQVLEDAPGSYVRTR